MDKKFVDKEGLLKLSKPFICKTCLKSAVIPLKSPEEEKEFAHYKKGFNCSPCALKFWQVKIVSGEINLVSETPEFRRAYQELEKEQNRHERH